MSHRDHNSENGSDDSEAGKTVRRFRENTDGEVMFFFHRFQFDIHEVPDIFRANRSVDNRTEGAFDEVGRMVIRCEFGIFGEDSAFVRVGNMAFEG